MKKTILYILIIAALAGVAYYLISKNQYENTLESIYAEYDFAVKDTSAITKIIIADKTPSRVELTREGNKWKVNEKYEARPDAIEVLLETLNRMSMQNFVPIPSQETIIKRMAVYGKEVEVYEGDTKIKHLFVGTETPDQTATYMMLKGASQPFTVHIQGFVGYLNSRFFTGEDLWRRRILFGLEKNEIKNVAITYTNNDAASFLIENQEGSSIIKDLDGNIVNNTLEVNKNVFLGSFKTASYEGTIVPTDGVWPKRDSLMNSTPIFTLTINDIHGNQQTMSAHYKKPDQDQVGDDGHFLEHDPSRMYAFLSDGRWVLIQYFGLKNIIVDKQFFTQELVFDN